MDDKYISIDEASGIETIEKTPYEMIKDAAVAFNIDIREPKKSCRYCYGRGWTGIQNGVQPIPCSCVMPKMNLATKKAWEGREFIPRNRKERRAISNLRK